MNEPLERSSPPRPMAERIGISQGRLVPSATGELQCSPGEKWRDEFMMAATLGLSHIELLAERRPEPSNPIWSAEGRSEMAALARSAGVAPASLCLDEALDRPLDDTEFAVEMAARLAPVLSELPLQVTVLPLMEASDLNDVDWSAAARSVRMLADELQHHGARLVLESGVEAAQTLRFLSIVESPGVGVCYDLGNATALGFDTPDELRLLGRHVWHLHAKDKDASHQNVRFGTGNTQFGPALEVLAAQRFDGLVTMEATRGDDPIATAAEHRAFLLSTEAAGNSS